MGKQHDFVRSYLDAWNENDAPGIVDHFVPDGCYVDVPTQQELSGDSLVNHLIDYFREESYRYELAGNVLTDGNTIAFQYQVVAQNGDGSPLWNGAEFIQMKGATAKFVNDYYRVPSASRRRSNAASDRYAKSGLNEDTMARLLGGLQQAMETEKAYLDPDLSLPRLAEALGCSVNHLSQAINAGHAMSFFDYVNQFRVAEAASMLREKDRKLPAVLDIALSAGFNSTSTFYNAFKKATGQTPGSYRRSQTSS